MMYWALALSMGKRRLIKILTATMTSLTENGFFSQMMSSCVESMPNPTIGVKYTLVRNAKSNEIGPEDRNDITDLALW